MKSWLYDLSNRGEAYLQSLDLKQLLKLAVFKPSFYFLGFILGMMTMGLIIILINKRSFVRLKRQYDLLASFLAEFRPEKGLEETLMEFLGLIVKRIHAEGYYAYLYDSKNEHYVLKAMRQGGETGGGIEPSYSGLAPYKGEKYNPPLSLVIELPSQPELVKLGEVPLLVIPIKGGQGMFLVGPLKKIPEKIIRLMDYLGKCLEHPLSTTVNLEKMRNQIHAVTATNKAIKSLTNAAQNLDDSLSALVGLSLKVIDAEGGCLIFWQNEVPNIAFVSGLGNETEKAFRNDVEAHKTLLRIGQNDGFVIITPETENYSHIPSYMVADSVQSMIVLGLKGNRTSGVIAFWFSEPRDVEQHRLTALSVLVQRMSEAFERQEMSRAVSTSYISTLRTLVDQVDNFEPITVGHSLSISRYSGIIAKELGLGDNDIREIILAGYMHDIGMLGLAGDILFKEGKYSEVELEAMKLHAEVGASIIETTIANHNVASYIRHHHERWDGCGYPEAKKGDEIPLGARIIAVADTFNAKLSGRKDRGPLPFAQALTAIQASAGTQLEARLVQILADWFKKKQHRHRDLERPLGRCSEMKCCPPNLADNCPASINPEKNCWEIKETRCAMHGSTCDTCAVFTEFLSRKADYSAGQV